jgi:toxin YoeB
MDIFWDKTAWEDYLYWQKNDKKVLNKLNSLIKECQCKPFKGSGKPEPLRQNFSGFWSRRITGEHFIILVFFKIFGLLKNLFINLITVNRRIIVICKEDN